MTQSFKRLAVSAFAASALLCSSLSYAEVSVIVNPGNANAVDAKEIKRIFLGKQKKFADGSSVVAVAQPGGSAIVEAFSTSALGRSSNQIKAYWAKLIFTGKGTPPQEVADDAAVKSMVSSTPGAIGYIDSGSVDGSVKVVATF